MEKKHKEIEIPLPNNFTVIIDNVDDRVFVSLKNPNNFIVTDVQLSKSERELIKDMM